MPLMDGMLALEAIREVENLKGIQYGRGSKIIMTTAVDESKTIMNSFNKGCEGYLIKPYADQELLQKIDQLMGSAV